jgi:hypothetical protein
MTRIVDCVSCKGKPYKSKKVGQPNRPRMHRALPHYVPLHAKVRRANLIIGDGGIIIGLTEEEACKCSPDAVRSASSQAPASFRSMLKQQGDCQK